MVCTRKKDYGKPPVKERKPPLTEQDLSVRSDSAAEVGFTDDTRGIACLPQGAYLSRIPLRADEQSNPRFERINHSVVGSTIVKNTLLTAFPRFRMLPCEIRLLIWETSMTSQLIAVKPKSDGRRDAEHNRPKLFLPAIFCVNNEARQRALRHYRWRFTLRLVTLNPNQSVRLHGRQVLVSGTTVQHARVVMSAHDTLGFMGWRFQKDVGYRWNIEIHGADETSPWERQTTAHESQVKLDKVAILGSSLEADPRIIYDLNCTPSFDVDTILHAKPWMKLRIIRGPWYNLKETIYSKQSIYIRHFTLTSDLQEWGEELLRTVPEPAKLIEAPAPAIMSFELMRKREEGVDVKNISLSAYTQKYCHIIFLNVRAPPYMP